MRSQYIDDKSAGKARYFLRKMLSRTDASEYCRGHKSGRLSTPHLYRAMTGEQNLFQRRLERDGTNTFVSVAIDASGSMSGSKAEAAAKLACTLSSALSGCVGVKHDVIAWTTYACGVHCDTFEVKEVKKMRNTHALGYAVIGEDDIYSYARGAENLIGSEETALTYLKTDNEPTGKLCRLFEHATSNILSCAGTPAFGSLSAAVRQAKSRNGFNRKFVLFLTDGIVSSSEERMMRRLCIEARKFNVYVIGVGVKAEARRCFEDNAYITVWDMADLGGKAMQKLVDNVSKTMQG